jgi:hypothetical protein
MTYIIISFPEREVELKKAILMLAKEGTYKLFSGVTSSLSRMNPQLVKFFNRQR